MWKLKGSCLLRGVARIQISSCLALRTMFWAATLYCSVHYTFSTYWGYGASQVVLMVKNLSANAGDMRDAGSVLGLRRSLGVGNGNLLQYSCLGNPMDGGAWRLQSMGSVEALTLPQVWNRLQGSWSVRGKQRSCLAGRRKESMLQRGRGAQRGTMWPWEKQGSVSSQSHRFQLQHLLPCDEWPAFGGMIKGKAKAGKERKGSWKMSQWECLVLRGPGSTKYFLLIKLSDLMLDLTSQGLCFLINKL